MKYDFVTLSKPETDRFHFHPAEKRIKRGLLFPCFVSPISRNSRVQAVPLSHGFLMVPQCLRSRPMTESFTSNG